MVEPFFLVSGVAMQFLKRGLGRLTDFSGRDPRRLFWPYAGVLFLLLFVVMGGVNSTFMARAMTSMQTNAPPNFSLMVGAMGVEMLVFVGLLAAAVARRLHDTGRTAYWGLAPLPFLAFGIIGFSIVVRSFDKPFSGLGTLFVAIFFNNVLYLAALVTLIVLLARPTRPEANRYGEPPAA